MSDTAYGTELSARVRDFIRQGFRPRFGTPQFRGRTHPLWRRLRELGTELWLDSGDIEAIEDVWGPEFTALTTNNTLLNREVQKGTYDELVVQAAGLLDDWPDLTDRQRKLEMAFILNARHALKLVERFDAHVSVEEHTDLAGDVEGSVQYARRFYAVCPERFYVKVPLSPAGLLATRRICQMGIPVNHTLGFSARQNHLIARIGRPAFVNVFLGRLNSFVADNGLGDGAGVGERAALASQGAVRVVRGAYDVPTRQIAASIRAGAQLADLAGVDVMTIPPKAAGEFLRLDLRPEDLSDRTRQEAPRPGVRDGVDQRAVGLHTLWDVDEQFIACADALSEEDLDTFTPGRLVDFFAEHGCGDAMVRWSDRQRRTSAEEGKIPRLDNWRQPLAEGRVGLDSLMNLAGWNSFDADQKEMDGRVRETLWHAMAAG